MGGDGKVFTLEEVSQHTSNQDCWIVIDGKVYDVTKFLDDHPGGDEVILTSTGKDATDDFEDVGHSSTAKAMLDEYYVGDIDSATVPAKTKFVAPPSNQTQSNQNKSSDFLIKILQFLVPLLILGLALGIRSYTKTPSS
ncbi:cytochrome B5 [Brassica rapa]|uniref:Cytochrome b5 heme-binding domain-containing protein n=1 Tax=Brassica campestris TaxID=3711 RepID=M4F8P9_BRACM|nr:cytochrome B5 [Brassica rapa]